MRYTLLALALLLTASGIPAGAREQTPSGPDGARKQMPFGSDGAFKIVQITDTHIDPGYGGAEDVFGLIDRIIGIEKPDLVVFGGDMVTCRKPLESWRRLFAEMGASGVAWTMVFGNHDHEYGLSRERIYELAATAQGAIIEKGPEEVEGTGNFVIELLAHDTGLPANALWFMDSHSLSPVGRSNDYAWIDATQIDWYRRLSDEYRLPSVVFFHIPLPEYAEAAKGKMIGRCGEEVCSPRFNSGMFDAIIEKGDIRGVFAGHDHDNDFIADYKGIALAYGRFSGGKAAYGSLKPGARVIILRQGESAFSTYIRLADGEIIDPCTFPDDFEAGRP